MSLSIRLFVFCNTTVVGIISTCGVCFQETTDTSWNSDQVILEAAKSIAAATSALVKAASAAQRELIDSGKVKKN